MTKSVVKGPYIFHSGCAIGATFPKYKCLPGSWCGSSVRECNHCSFERCYKYAEERNATAFAYRKSDGGFCKTCNQSEFADVEPMFDWGVYEYKAPTTEPTTAPTSTSKTNITVETSMITMSPEVETNKSDKSTFPTTEVNKLENTKSANKPTTRAPIREKKYTGSATNHFLSIIVFSVMFVPFFLNA